MANSLSPQEIDELAQMVHDRFGGDTNDLRAKIDNVQPFIRQLSHIADHPDALESVLSNLTTNAARASDRAIQKSLTEQALCMLLFTRVRRGPNVPPEQTAHQSSSRPFGYHPLPVPTEN
jgi:signal transduction histidine kinase